MQRVASVPDTYGASMAILLKRANVAKEHTWNLESIFPDLDAWEQAFATLQSEGKCKEEKREKMRGNKVEIIK